MPYRKLRPMPHEQVERNRAMVEYHLSHPEATYEQIGLLFHVSKPRAYKLIKRELENRAASKSIS